MVRNSSQIKDAEVSLVSAKVAMHGVKETLLAIRIPVPSAADFRSSEGVICFPVAADEVIPFVGRGLLERDSAFPLYMSCRLLFPASAKTWSS